MLGKSICDRNGDTFEALSLADFYTYQGGESYKKYISANPNDTELIKNDTRITGDVIFKADFIEKPLVDLLKEISIHYLMQFTEQAITAMINPMEYA